MSLGPGLISVIVGLVVGFTIFEKENSKVIQTSPATNTNIDTCDSMKSCSDCLKVSKCLWCANPENLPDFTRCHMKTNSADWKNKCGIHVLEPNSVFDTDKDIEDACQCSTSRDNCQNPETGDVCSNQGDCVCNECQCSEGIVGAFCEINIGVMSEDSCKLNQSSMVCSGMGSCKYGRCECNHRDNPIQMISGTYCECTNYLCPVSNGRLCSGPDHGECVCNSCSCHPGWMGKTCECLASTANCLNPENGRMCSDNGVCECNRCNCPEGYIGKFCEECPTCKSGCVKLKPCAQCFGFGKGPLRNKCKESCSEFRLSLVDKAVVEDKENERLCSFYDDDDCRFNFVYGGGYNGHYSYFARIARTRQCPPPLDYTDAKPIDLSKCRPDEQSTLCSGKGSCLPEGCQCFERENPQEIVSGVHCECTNFTCDRYEGQLCSGPSHGRCECNSCICNAGWTGTACECSKAVNNCRNPETGDVCSNQGDCVCNECQCDEGIVGAFCEINTALISDERCKFNESAKVCSGVGSCVQGSCECYGRNNPKEIISGAYCECTNFLCPHMNGKRCSGKRHGRCRCNSCLCRPGWKGEACECNTRIRNCKNPETDQICSDNGICDCNRCKCYQGYHGKFCQDCPTCMGICTELKPCVQCVAFGNGPLKDDCERMCSQYSLHLVDNLVEEGSKERLCSFFDEDDCRFSFIYGYRNRHVYGRVAKAIECPPPRFI